MLAVTGSLKFNPLRKSKIFLYPKGVFMFNSIKIGFNAVVSFAGKAKDKALAALGLGAAVLATAPQKAAAALTATDVPMTTATADVTLVFLAILGVSIVLYGFRKILGLTGK